MGDCTEYWDLLHNLHWEFNNQRQEAGLLQTVHWDRSPRITKIQCGSGGQHSQCVAHILKPLRLCKARVKYRLWGYLDVKQDSKERSQWCSQEAAACSNLSTALICRFYIMWYRDKGLSCQDDKSYESQDSPERQNQTLCVCVFIYLIGSHDNRGWKVP